MTPGLNKGILILLVLELSQQQYHVLALGRYQRTIPPPVDSPSVPHLVLGMGRCWCGWTGVVEHGYSTVELPHTWYLVIVWR